MFRYDLGDGVELRLLEDRHAAALFALTDRNREHLRAWLPWVDATATVAATNGFVRSAMLQYAENNGFQAGIWHNGEITGVIGHHIDWSNHKTELGYWLGAEYQGRGLMRRACHAVVDHAFSELGLNRVTIRCAIGNTRSRTIPEQLGFSQEGVMRQVEWLYDHFVDVVVYGMLASEWQGMKTEN